MRLHVMFRAIVSLCLLLLLIGCGTTSQTSSTRTHYTYQPPVAERGKICIRSCQQELKRCESQHHSVNQNCLNQQQAAATRQFELYKQTQAAQGEELKETWRSFYHPEMCRKIDKGCMQDYRTCYQLCGGKVAMHEVKRNLV